MAIPVAVSSMAGSTAQSPHLNILAASGVVSCWGCANATTISAAVLLPFDV